MASCRTGPEILEYWKALICRNVVQALRCRRGPREHEVRQSRQRHGVVDRYRSISARTSICTVALGAPWTTAIRFASVILAPYRLSAWINPASIIQITARAHTSHHDVVQRQGKAFCAASPIGVIGGFWYHCGSAFKNCVRILRTSSSVMPAGRQNG